MAIGGVVCEYNPFHRGHAYHLQTLRRRLGTEGGIVCVMSGNFVQRGDFALLDKYRRTAAALDGGADLVLELPLPWATASAEGFARGAVGLLAATGLVDILCFGSESADCEAIEQIAALLLDPAFSPRLKEELTRGCSFPAARQQAAQTLAGRPLPQLATANDLLAIEYAKAIRSQETGFALLPVLRKGAAHDEGPAAGYASASYLRTRLRQGQRVDSYLTPPMAVLLEQAWEEGCAPADSRLCERAILARLRAMREEELAAYDEGGEGLYHRVYRAVASSCSVEEILSRSKTKRYPHARLRRMLLRAYLDVPTALSAGTPPYLRVLGASSRGCQLLKQMKSTATLPVLFKAAQARTLGEAARRLMEKEARSTDLYALALPRVTVPGSEWRRKVLLREAGTYAL